MTALVNALLYPIKLLLHEVNLSLTLLDLLDQELTVLSDLRLFRNFIFPERRRLDQQVVRIVVYRLHLQVFKLTRVRSWLLVTQAIFQVG